jgi:hypothetical protein
MHVRRWDMDIPLGATILLVGKRNTGKSVCFTDIMYHMKDKLDLMVGMSGSEAGNGQMGKFLPPAFIYSKFDNKKVHHILEWQRRLKLNGKKFNMGLLMDDCVETNKDGGKKRTMSSGYINQIFKMGRHYDIFYINAIQGLGDAPPDVRKNTDILIAFGTSDDDEIKALHKNFFSMFTLDEFRVFFARCTRDFECVVIDMRKFQRTPDNCVFFFKAKLHLDPFRVGAPVWWSLSKYYFVDRVDKTLDAAKVLGFNPDTAGCGIVDTAPTRRGRRGAGVVIREDEGEEELLV